MTKVIAIASPSGGVGKTTIAICLANEIYRNNASVCVIHDEKNSSFDIYRCLREYHNLKKRFDAFSLSSISDISSFINSGRYGYIIFDIERKDAYSSEYIFNKSDLVLVPLKHGGFNYINTMPFLGYLSGFIKEFPFAVIFNELNKCSKGSEGDMIKIIESRFRKCNVIEESIDNSIYLKRMTFNGFALDEMSYKRNKKISHILNDIISLMQVSFKLEVNLKK